MDIRPAGLTPSLPTTRPVAAPGGVAAGSETTDRDGDGRDLTRRDTPSSDESIESDDDGTDPASNQTAEPSTGSTSDPPTSLDIRV